MKKIKRFLCINLIFTMILMNCLSVFAISDIDITSPSAILMDQSSGNILFEKNGDEVKSAASLMKIMVLLIAMEALDSGKIAINDGVVTSDNAAKVLGADVWMKSGEVMKVEDLIKAVSIVSANDASVALAEHISGSEEEFVKAANDKAKQLGMKDTIFKDSFGSEESGSVTSAKDVAIMSRELMQHKRILPYVSTWIDHIRDGQTQIVNTNKMIKTYQGITGLKTGTSEKSGSCISATAERGEIKLIAVVLGGANSKDRFKDASSLLDYGFSSYTTVKPKIPEELPDKIKVDNGMKDSIGITVDVKGEFVVSQGKENSTSYEIKMDEEIKAPIEAGQEIGKLVYKVDGKEICEYSIRTLEAVEEISFGAVLKNIVAEFLLL